MRNLIGLSLFIKYAGKQILLDAGSTGAFCENADAMGISLTDLDAYVLSHGHYDHSGGFEKIFDRDPAAKVYARKEALDIYLSAAGGMHEISIPQQSLVIDTSNGLVIFNSCSHAGAANIIREAKDAYGQKQVYAYVGGLHMKGKKDGREVCAFDCEPVFTYSKATFLGSIPIMDGLQKLICRLRKHLIFFPDDMHMKTG